MAKKAKDPNAGPPPLTLHTCVLDALQAAKLKALLQEMQWGFEPRPYTLYFAKKDRLTVAVYEKGHKTVIQGKGTEEFVRFTLEPEIIGEARLGYEEVHNPDWFTPHIGVDESGKGDFFGPLVIAGCFTDETSTRSLLESKVTDSKKIGSDVRIRELAKKIRETAGIHYSVVVVGPERYNELYKKFGNLNRLLAWGHARVIENVLEFKPDCPRALSDQFANPALIKRALLEKGRQILLEARTKAESDPAVAAASILAREKFIDWMDQASRDFSVRLPRGASAAVKTAALDIIKACDGKILSRISKTHFRTAHEIAPDVFPPPVSRPGLSKWNQST